MPLIFDDDGRDLEVPDPMTERWDRQWLRTCRTDDMPSGGSNDLLTLLRRQQRTLVLFMTGLTTAFSGGLGLGRRRLVEDESRRGRLRRIGGRGGLAAERAAEVPRHERSDERSVRCQRSRANTLAGVAARSASETCGRVHPCQLQNTRSAILTLHRSVNGYVEFFTKEGIAFIPKSNRAMRFKVDLQQLKNHQSAHEWLAQRLAPQLIVGKS